MFDFLLGNDFVSALLAFGLVLIPAVIIHELGHLLAAKMVGITILEFGVGYPPRALRLFRWGETEFTFNWIPLGGFVRPFGEDMVRPQTAEEVERERQAIQNAAKPSDEAGKPADSDRARLLRLGITQPKSVNDVKPLARIWFMVAGALANVVGALIIFIAIGLTGVENVSGRSVFVANVSDGSALAVAGVQAGDVIESVDGQRFADANAFVELLSTQTEPVVLGVVRAAEGAETVTRSEVTLAPLGGIGEKTFQLLVVDFQADSPAAASGMQPGDVLLSADGRALNGEKAFEVLQQANRENEGNPYVLKVQRGEETVSLTITPRVNPGSLGHIGAGVQTIQGVGAWGVSLANGQRILDYTPLGLGEAIGYGFNEVGVVLRTIAEMPARILNGQATPEESRVVSIVGISQIGGVLLQDSVALGNVYPLLRFAALISIALGITNLLPIPPLDGGRVLLVLIEMVRGKPLSQRVEETIMLVGLFLMLLLGVMFIINDIRNPLIDMLR